MRRIPPILPTEPCPKCGGPMANGRRRCYRCHPAGKRKPSTRPPYVPRPNPDEPDPATIEPAVAEAVAAKDEVIQASHRWIDLTASSRAKFARLAAEERERTAMERRVQMNRKG